MERNVRRNSGFTLVEILIVLVIIAILAAILFPAFSRARESARQASCASNLQQIGMAMTLYKQDEKKYPASLAALLPADALLDDTTTTATDDTVDNTKGTGYLKSVKNLLCPNEPRDDKAAVSSYGDVSTNINKESNNTDITVTADNMGRFVWNYWGYKADGTAFKTAAEAKAADTPDKVNDGTVTTPNPRLVNSTLAFQPDPAVTAFNPIKNSMSNRFATASTIVSHCVYHRYSMTGVDADQIYVPANVADAKSALDIVLLLDGSAKKVNVSNYNNASGWQK